jgi:hypothetical protein
MSKTYQQMTQAERTADRIAKNRANEAAVAPVIRLTKRRAAEANNRKIGQLLVEFHDALPVSERAPLVHFLTTLARR